MEEFRKIKDFEMYEISNLGNLRRIYSYGYKQIKPSIKFNEYPKYTLSKEGKLTSFKVHILVAKCFLDYIPKKGVIVVDHIDNDKLNYNLNNLKIISMRENLIKDSKRESKYPNVYKNRKKWRARINYNNYNYCLGTYDTQEIAYQKIIEFLEKMEGGCDG